MTATTGPTYARPKRRGPWLRRWAVAALVLLVLAVVLDRGGDALAERLAADNIQSSQHLAHRPDVGIDGVPFLTQFARRDYDHVTVDAHGLSVADGALRVSHLHVDLYHLTISRDFATFHVDSATARATLSYADLGARLGVDVGYAGSNRIRASKTFDLPVIGRVSPTISVRPALVNGALTFGASSINGAGEQLGAVTQALHALFDVRIPLSGLPFQIRVRALHADATGVQADFTGADLTFTKG